MRPLFPQLLLLVLLGLGACPRSLGQSVAVPDSAAQALAAVSGATHAGLLKDLGNAAYEQKAYALAEYYWQQGYRWADSLGLPDVAGQCLNNLGVIANKQKDYPRYLGYALEALATYQTYGLDTLLGDALHNVGLAYKNVELLDSALSYLTQALDEAYMTQDTALHYKTLLVAGNVYRQLERYPLAEEYELRAMDYYRATGNRKQLSQALTNLGNVFLYSDRPGEALGWYWRSLALKRLQGNPGLLLYNLGLTYTQLGQIDSALYYHTESLSFQDTRLDSAYAFRALGNTLLMGYRYPAAQAYYAQALALLTLADPLQLRKEIYEGLRGVAQGNGRYRLALQYQDSVSSLDERIQRERNDQTAAAYAQLLRLKDIEQDRTQKALQLEAARVRELRNRGILFGLGALAIGLSIAFFFALRYYRLEQRAPE